MSRTSISYRVFENLELAMENGYDMRKLHPKDVVDDLLTYADYDFQEEIEEMDHSDLRLQVREAVEEWQRSKKDAD